METVSQDDAAARHAHVSKLTSRAALMRILHIVEDTHNEDRTKRAILKWLCIGLAVVFGVVVLAQTGALRGMVRAVAVLFH